MHISEYQLISVHCDKMWYFLLCSFSPFLKRNILPQRSQLCEIPVMWCASLCSFMWAFFASFPQTLQIIALKACPPIWSILSVLSITEEICSSSCPISTVFRFPSISTTSLLVSSPMSGFNSTNLLELMSWETNLLGLWTLVFMSLIFWSTINPFSFNSSGKARKESRRCW